MSACFDRHRAIIDATDVKAVPENRLVERRLMR
jgi:hypothetical protein